MVVVEVDDGADVLLGAGFVEGGCCWVVSGCCCIALNCCCGIPCGGGP